MIITNRNKRCAYCHGREVITLEKGEKQTSLEKDGEHLRCKDREECRQNIEAEATSTIFSMNEDGDVVSAKIFKLGNQIMEVSKDYTEPY
jgi:hypothetical protein